MLTLRDSRRSVDLDQVSVVHSECTGHGEAKRRGSTSGSQRLKFRWVEIVSVSNLNLG